MASDFQRRLYGGNDAFDVPHGQTGLVFRSAGYQRHRPGYQPDLAGNVDRITDLKETAEEESINGNKLRNMPTAIN